MKTRESKIHSSGNIWLNDNVQSHLNSHEAWSSGNVVRNIKRVMRDENNDYRENTTFSGRYNLNYINAEVRRIIEPIINSSHNIKNENEQKQIQELITDLTELIIELNLSDYDVSRLPQIKSTILEDESALLEWIFLNFRLGFVIEKKRSDSFWYLVSKAKDTDSNSSGKLNVKDKKNIIKGLITYVILNN